MATGLARENWKWYVRRRVSSKSGAAGGADCGPYKTEEKAKAAMEQRFSKTGRELYIERVNIAALRAHYSIAD